MSTTPVIDTTAVETHATVAGLRELADLLEQHPDLAEAVGGQRILIFCPTVDEFTELARQLGGKRTKSADDEYFDITRTFGAVGLQVYTRREQVCTAKVVGTETVEVPDPAAPLVTVTRDVIEWECTPSLLDERAAAIQDAQFAAAEDAEFAA